MMIAATSLIVLGSLGLLFGVMPDWWLGHLARVVPAATAYAPPLSPAAVLSVAGALYLSGIVLVAAAILRRLVAAYVEAFRRERDELQMLQSSMLLTLERIEFRLDAADRQKKSASTELKNLAAELGRAVPAVADRKGA
jgi:hypothetical protein